MLLGAKKTSAALARTAIASSGDEPLGAGLFIIPDKAKLTAPCGNEFGHRESMAFFGKNLYGADPMDSPQPQADYLDLSEPGSLKEYCRTFEQVLASKKLHQYLRILARKGVLDIDTSDDDRMMDAFLADASLQQVAEDAWERQPVLVTVASGTNVHNLAYHIRQLLVQHLFSASPGNVGVRDMPNWPTQLKKALRRSGYTHMHQLIGKSVAELEEISEIGPVFAARIFQDVQDMHARANAGRAISGGCGVQKAE